MVYIDFPYTAFGIPIAVFLVESYVQNIPGELEEAAAIDGSSFSRTLFTIILPVCLPILVTVGIIQFSTWNEFTLL
ncbi:MAG: ABC transporter permease subunit [Blautia marasmi]